MVDVDGSYLHHKQHLVGVESSDVPAVPSVSLTGWELMDNVTNLNGLPKVTHGMILY